MRVGIRALEPGDREEFLAAVRRSRGFHRPWVQPPSSAMLFHAYVVRSRRVAHESHLVCLRATAEIVGVVNLGEIVRGHFRSAYLGYYGFHPHAGKGYMTEGMRLVIAHAFRTLKLHRLEANIQPENRASIALVRRLGFRREGYSPRYLKIGGRWRDHERWAILAEEWAPTRRKPGGDPP
ncbi:MAG: GNAT family N-acetyltransferase [Acidobacteriia bacterium]|nr:GNAT family N-acetyltransferase [Terriglobia bacterium]